jgi:methionine--tRNA ligase beta chain
MDTISYDDFAKLDLRIAKIIGAEPIENSEKLIRLHISLGEEERQILAGIKKAYIPEDLVGKTIVIIANLEPRKLMGEISEGMLLAASEPDGLPVLLTVLGDIAPGSKIH